MSGRTAVSCAEETRATASRAADADAPDPAEERQRKQHEALSVLQHGADAPSARISADAEPTSIDCLQAVHSSASQCVSLDKTASDASGDTASTAEGEFCLNLPGQDRAQLSSALICDTLASLPVLPEAVSHVQGPSLEIHQVDDNSVDVRIVHSFRATYAEPLANVEKKAVAYLQQQHAAEAAARAGTSAAAAQQAGSPFQAAAAAVHHSPQHHRHHHHHHHHHHQHHHDGDDVDSEQGTNCFCTELQEGEDQLLPHSIKRSACYVVHEREPSTEADDALVPATSYESLSGGAASDAEISAPSTHTVIQYQAATDKQAAAPAHPRAVSPFQAMTLEPFSLPGSSNAAAAAAAAAAAEVQQVQASHRLPKQPQQQQQQLSQALLKTDRGAAVHDGKRLSVEVMTAVGSEDHSNAVDSTGNSASAHQSSLAPPTAVYSSDRSPAGGQATATCRSGSGDIFVHQQQASSNSTSSSGPSSSSTSNASVSPPASGATVAVVPGPAAGQGWQQQQQVLVKLMHRKTAHGHEEIDVAPLHAAGNDNLISQQQQQQEMSIGSPLSTYAADMQHRQRELVLHQQLHYQQQQYGANQLDMNIVQPPQGYVPLTGQGFRAPELQHWQQQQQGYPLGQGAALLPVPGQPSPTLMMPRKGIMGRLHPRAAPRQGFVPRCEWELDPRRILVGRRLAVGGFAEVFIGKYEGTVVAIKRLLTNDAPTIERFVSEVRMLARLRHPNLILFMGYCTMPELCIVSEYMSKGSLYSVLHSPEQRKERLLAATRQRKQQQAKHQQLQQVDAQHSGLHDPNQQQQHSDSDTAADANKTEAAAGASRQMSLVCGQPGFDQQQPLSPEQEEQAQMESLEPKLQKLVAISVARGMAYLHTRNPPILHLDLKSPNILVDDRWRVKITDFGLSRARQQTFVSSSAQGGTPEWMAPEVLRCEAVAEPADVYSYGVVLWELITGRAPWENYNPMQVVAIVGFRELSLPLPATAADPFLLELCRRCLQRDPAARPTFTHIAALLDQHYGPPTWSSHAQPLMPPTPRPALPAPTGAVGAAHALQLLQQQQEQQHQEEQRQPHQPHMDSMLHTDHLSHEQKLEASSGGPRHLEQQQQPEHESEHTEQTGVIDQGKPDAADQQQHVEQQLPQNEQESMAYERITADNTGNSVPKQAQPSPFAGSAFSPFASNFAPWSVDSVRSVADEAPAAAAAAAAAGRSAVMRPDIASSTITDSSRDSQQVSHSMEPLSEEQQPASMKFLPSFKSGGCGAVGAGDAAAPAADVTPSHNSSSVRSEMHRPLPAPEAASAVAAAAAAAEHVRQLELQQEQCRSATVASPDVDGCLLQPGPACSLTPVKIGGCDGSSYQQQGVQDDVRGVRDLPSRLDDDTAAVAGNSRVSCMQITVAAAAADGHASGGDAVAEHRAVDTDGHPLLQNLPPHGQACLRAAAGDDAAAAAASHDTRESPAVCQPSTAPAGSVGSWTNLTNNSSHGQLPSDGSVMHGLWPSMTETSLNSLTASRQTSRSEQQCEREGCVRDSSSSSSSRGSSSSRAGTKPAAESCDMLGENCSRNEESQRDCGSNVGYGDGDGAGAAVAGSWGFPSAEQYQCPPPEHVSALEVEQQQQQNGSIQGAGDAGLLPQLQMDVQQQQQQHMGDDNSCSHHGMSDCSRGNSPDTHRQQQQQQQQQLPGAQLVYQVWPVVAAATHLPLLLDAPICDVVATLNSTPSTLSSKKAKHSLAGARPTAAAGHTDSAGDILLQQLGYSSPDKLGAVSANSAGQCVGAAITGVCDITSKPGALFSCNREAEKRAKLNTGDGVVKDVVAVNCDSGCDVAAAPAAMAATATAAHAAKEQQQQQQQTDQGVCVKPVINPLVSHSKPHQHSHSVDASVLQKAAQQAKNCISSSYQKGRFLVSTSTAGSSGLVRNASAGNLSPTALPPARAPLARANQRSSLNDLPPMEQNVGSGVYDTQKQHKQQQQKQKPSAANTAGPCSLPGHLLLQRQPASTTPTHRAAVGLAPTAASAVATCGADSSLGLMSAVVCDTGSMQPVHDCLAGPAVAVATTHSMAGSEQQQDAPQNEQEVNVHLLSPTQMAGLPKHCSDPVSPTGFTRTAAGCQGLLASPGHWGSQAVPDVVAAEKQPAAAAAGVQSPASNAFNSSKGNGGNEPQQERQCYVHGISSPGSLRLNGGTSTTAAGDGKVGGALVQPVSTQLLHTLHSIGGLSYRTGRFSVTVQQQELHKTVAAAAAGGAATDISSSTGSGALTAAGTAPSAMPQPLTPSSVVEAAVATDGHEHIQQYQQLTQHHALIHPSASCGALPYLAEAQQQKSLLLSPPRQSVLQSGSAVGQPGAAGHGAGIAEPSTLPAGAFSIRRVPFDFATPAAAAVAGCAGAHDATGVVGVSSHFIEGEASSSSLWSWDSDQGAAHQQHMPQHQATVVDSTRQHQGATECAVAANSKADKQLKQQGHGHPLHQRRMLAHAPAHLFLPTPAAANSGVAHCTMLQQQQHLQWHNGQHPVASSAVAGQSGRASDTLFCSLSSVPSISRTISNSSTASAFSPRSTAAANPAAKPPLMPVSCKTPSPGSTPLQSPRPKAAAAAVARDYCRGRFQVHESPLVGPWQAWRSSSSGGGSNSCAALPYACGPCPTPLACSTSVAAVAAAEASAGSCLHQEQQQQQHGASVVHPEAVAGSAAAAVTTQPISSSCSTSPAPCTCPVAKAAAGSPKGLATAATAPVASSPVTAAAAVAGLDTASTAPATGTAGCTDASVGTVKKLGRFTVKHESSSGNIGRSSKPGSAASSTHGSRAGSPRGEHVVQQPSKLGMTRHVPSTGSLPQVLHSVPTAAAAAAQQPGTSPYSSTPGVAGHSPATAVAAAATAIGSPGAVAVSNSIAPSSKASGAAAAAAATVKVSDSGALSDTEAVAATAAASASGHHLAPIKTVSRKGRFVVTQLTPGSTACNTPKSEMYAVPDAILDTASGVSPCLGHTGQCGTAVPTADSSKGTYGCATAAAAEADGWLEAAVAGAATGATRCAGLVLACPVCQTQHTVTVTPGVACSLSTGVAAGSSAGDTGTPKTSVSVLKAAAAAASNSQVARSSAAAAAGCDTAGASGADAAVATAGVGGLQSIATTPGRLPRCSSSAVAKLPSPSNTPRATSLVHTCSICGAPLPSVVGALSSATPPVTGGITAAAAASDSQHQQPAEVLPVVDQVALTPQTELLLQTAIPQGLLAEAAARVLATRQEQLTCHLPAESSSSTVASRVGVSSTAAVYSSNRSSTSSIGPTAAAGAAVHVGSGDVAMGVVEGHGLPAVAPVTIWQLPHSHPLQLDTPGGSFIGSSYSSCYSSPVDSITSPTPGGVVPAAAAVLLPSAGETAASNSRSTATSISNASSHKHD